jgi:hypothetical protein
MIYHLSLFVRCIEYHTQIETTVRGNFPPLYFFFNKTTNYLSFPQLAFSLLFTIKTAWQNAGFIW